MVGAVRGPEAEIGIENPDNCDVNIISKLFRLRNSPAPARGRNLQKENADYESEISFWKEALTGKKVKFVEDALNPATREDIFPARLRPYVGKNNQKLRLLDVGSGPISPFAWGIDMNLLDVVAIDPLADAYNALLAELNYSYPIKPVKCYGEDIVDNFQSESFDIVYCANALDHAISPQRCLDGMYDILKKDGIMYLTGYIREGTRSSWSGLHQHDLIPENGQLLHYDPKGNKTNLTKDLVGVTCIYEELSGTQIGDIYVIIFRKSGR
jgi:SAM-dependent methyltransferase